MLFATRLCVYAVCLAGFVTDCLAQNQHLPLVERYRRARLTIVVDSVLHTLPPTLPFRSPVHLDTPADTLVAWVEQWQRKSVPAAIPESPPEEGDRWKLYSRLERSLFEQTFSNTLWAFLGTTRYRTPVDTTNTSQIRARLQAAFGAPTRTVMELDDAGQLAPGDYIQFEYWFVLNDTIPLKVVDVNGPMNRGVIVASDERYRDTLFEIRQTFLEEVVTDTTAAPFTDYYYHYETRRWYRAGYTGIRYFVERIAPPNRELGRPRIHKPEG